MNSNPADRVSDSAGSHAITARSCAAASQPTGCGIQFYHLTTTPLERALPKLLEKAHGAGLRALVLAESDERVEQLNQLLWTYDPTSFLPHGSLKDGNSESQPILLSSAPDAPNGAKLLVVTNGALAPESGYERVLDMFDGRDEAAVAAARERWKSYKDGGRALTYFKQTDAGGWEQKIIA